MPADRLTSVPTPGYAARLFAADIRMVCRDPLLASMPVVPFLAAVALRFILPPVSLFVEDSTGFRILDHADLIRVIITQFPGMFFGMVAGFLMLDDRDGGVSAYWGVTPVGRTGYLAARMGLFSAAAFVVSLAIGPLLGLGRIGAAGTLGVAALGAAQVPFFAMFLAAFAADKVEGLSILKALGGLDLAPLAVMLAMPVRVAGWPFPQYWAAEFALGRNAPPAIALPLGVATGVLWICGLASMYRKRFD
jgi:fluoroquinolone transport system permease protein